MNLLDIYNEKLKYNCSFTTMKHNGNDLLLVYLGTNDFIIVSNYCGVVVLGKYRFDFDIKRAFINYQIVNNHYNISTIENLIRKYERQIMKLTCPIDIERISSND